MREVQNQALVTMKSPIKLVMAHVHAAPRNVVRERVSEFDAQFSDYVLEFLDDHKWIAHVDVDDRHIRVSRRVVEVLWAASLAYLRVFEAIKERTAGRMHESVLIEFAADGELQRVMKLFQWAMESWLNAEDVPWPADLPRPVPNPTKKSDADCADELSLAATAFILHHELAHIRLRHAGPGDLDAERDADREAASWLLSGFDGDEDPKFIKRALGTATALGVLVARGIHTGDFGGTTHPRSFDRLMHALDRYVRYPNHLVWFFVIAMLTLHLDNADHGTAVSKGPYDSARACADAYVEAMSRDS